MPGQVIEGHAKLESDCKSCHVRFNKAAQSGLCKDCHKEVKADLRAGQGYHGRIDERPCKECHSDHLGRAADILGLDEDAFDHGKTDFRLGGKHADAKCESCHPKGKKHRAAPGKCVDCHRKDDVHKDALGPDCANCHDDRDWKKARFDHAKTKFPLLDKHEAVACKDCHVQNRYKNLPMACVSCHRKDDTHKGRFGDKCETCHDAADWKKSRFDHQRDGKWPLKGKHAETKCDACHKVNPYQVKGDTACLACHRKDDTHKGALGKDCGSCHNERSWKDTRFDHDKTKFKLLGKHNEVECALCHPDSRYKGVPQTCYGCHKALDDGRLPKGASPTAKPGHKGRYGEKCESCHRESKWSDLRFDHDRDTKYPLEGKHRKVACDDCHQGNLYRDKLKTDCVACHREDDRKKGHKGALGDACQNCHDAREWKVARFDHLRSRFPLTGAHVRTDCGKCHEGLDYRAAPEACGGCHQKEDPHKRHLGDACERCHNTRDWKIWDFDHDRETRFKLDGGHLRIRCEACHRQAGAEIRSLPLTCESCHGHDDIHEGAFGRRCDRCHLTTRFKEVRPGPLPPKAD